MTSNSKSVNLHLFITLFLYALINIDTIFTKNQPAENHPPVVKIIAPKNNEVFDWNTRVNYKISVADKEDGDSKFDEINVKEVLLEIRYIKDKSKIQAITNRGFQPDPPGLAVMRVSNCFNCHDFNGKSIGPSFYDISKRYPDTKSNTDTLVKHIRDGSSGAWGKEKMPTHAELSNEEIRNTVKWILKHAADQDVNYCIGTEGSFAIKQPVNSKANGVYLLTTSYVDHGLKASPGKQGLKAQDQVAIRIK